MRIPFLNGPSSHLHTYEVIQCDPPKLSMTGKITISAQSTENQSAPTLLSEQLIKSHFMGMDTFKVENTNRV